MYDTEYDDELTTENVGKLDWTKNAVLKLIELWSTHNCLYNPKHKAYRNKKVRHKVISDMTEVLKIDMPGIESKDVKLKMSHLRGQYCREMMKHSQSLQGSGQENKYTYTSTVYWFKKMVFIKDFVKQKKRKRHEIVMLPDTCDNSEEYFIDESNLSPPPEKKHCVSKIPLPSVSNEDEEAMENTSRTCNVKVAQNNNLNYNIEAFCNHMKLEITRITDEDLQDELQLKIQNLLYDYKVKQRSLNRTLSTK